MTDVHNAEPEDSPYLRVPLPLVTAGLLAILVVALAIGLFANRNLRPGVEPAPTPVPVREPALQPTLAPVAASPTLRPVTATPTALAAPTASQSPPLIAAATPTVSPEPTTPELHAPTLAAAPTSIAKATPRATVVPELAAEIGEAYKQYWEVRAEAFYNLDDSRLSSVMGGDHLAAIEDRIEELRSEGQAIDTAIEHNYAVIEASDDDAKLADSFVDQSVYIDLQTHAPMTTPTGQTLNEVYTLNKSDGTWKVVHLVRSL